jgi:hypothetical protein
MSEEKKTSWKPRFFCLTLAITLALTVASGINLYAKDKTFSSNKESSRMLSSWLIERIQQDHEGVPIGLYTSDQLKEKVIEANAFYFIAKDEMSLAAILLCASLFCPLMIFSCCIWIITGRPY